MTTETWIALIGALVSLVGFAVVLITLGCWGQRLESRIESLDRRVDAFASWGAGFSKEVSAFFGLAVRLLHRRQVLDDDELGEVTAKMASINQPAIEALFEKERRTRNPLAPDQLERLQSYVAMARRGQPFTPDQVQEYNRLVSILESERPTDPGIWPLLALGAFLLGLYMGAKGRES